MFLLEIFLIIKSGSSIFSLNYNVNTIEMKRIMQEEKKIKWKLNVY